MASTSIEIALAKQCGPDDIVLPIQEFDSDRDGEKYDHQPRNYEKYLVETDEKMLGEDRHMTPLRIKNMVDREIWEVYHKFSVVRNPWALMVSNYWWENGGTSSFEGYVVDHYLDNEQFYFDREGNEIVDTMLRFEDLENDYRDLCKKLDMKYEKLPRAKTRVKKKRDHYSTYYSDYTRDLISKRYRESITMYGYNFEDKRIEQVVDGVSIANKLKQLLLDPIRINKRKEGRI